MAATQEIIKVAIDVLPWMVTLVPERREERTTEGGLQVREHEKDLAKAIETFRSHNILVSLFIAPDLEQVKAAKRVNATHIELHTGTYANATTAQTISEELERIKDACIVARKLNLHVNAGHGLNYQNVNAIAAIDGIEELNIGHSIISRAALVGLDLAVRDMLALI